MPRAVGQTGEDLAAAEEEIRARGVADWPMAGRLVQFEKRQALTHRDHIVRGDRIGLDLDPKACASAVLPRAIVRVTRCASRIHQSRCEGVACALKGENTRR